MKSPRMSYKAYSKEEKKEFAKERKEHPSFNKEQIEQIVADHEAQEKEKTFEEIANMKVTPKMLVTYHTNEAKKELLKDNPDWEAVRWHQREATKSARVKSYLIPKRN